MAIKIKPKPKAKPTLADKRKLVANLVGKGKQGRQALKQQVGITVAHELMVYAFLDAAWFYEHGHGETLMSDGAWDDLSSYIVTINGMLSPKFHDGTLDYKALKRKASALNIKWYEPLGAATRAFWEKYYAER
jgi:hypothetical protein